MSKRFDSVAFQRGRREALSKQLSKMSPEEIVEYVHSRSLATKRHRRGRATAHNKRNNGAGRRSPSQ